MKIIRLEVIVKADEGLACILIRRDTSFPKKQIYLEAVYRFTVRAPRERLVAQVSACSFAEGITDSFSHSSWHIFSALSASINPQHSHRYACGLSS